MASAKARTAQFWERQFCTRFPGRPFRPGLALAGTAKTECPPPLREPTRRERLEWETELLDFPASGHPLELYNDIAWDTYCPVNRLGEHFGEQDRHLRPRHRAAHHHQVTGEPMKFLTLADWTGMVETELFAPTYRSYGLATVRYPVLEVTARWNRMKTGAATPCAC